MLTKETIEKIAGILKIDVADFTAKITAEKEETIEIPAGTYLSDDDLKLRDKNKYDEAKVAFEEMTVKKIKGDKKYEDFNGTKFDDLFKYHDAQLKSKYDSSADDRVKTLETDLENMRKTHSTEKETLSTQIKTLKTENQNQTVSSKIMGLMPEKTTIDKKDIVTLFRATHQINIGEDGAITVSKDGQVLKDPGTAAPIGLDSIFNKFVDEKGYISKNGGRGGGNEGGSGAGKAQNEMEFIEKWEKESEKSISSPEGVDALIAYQSENAGGE